MSRPALRTLYPAAALAVLLSLLRSTVESWVVAWRWFPYDGRVDWIVARGFLAGINPYTPASLRAHGLEGLGHPPSTGFWMLPFAHLSLADMSVVYGHVVLMLVFAMLLLIARELRWPWPTLTAAALFVAVTGTGWFKYQLMEAQIGALIAVAYVAAWALLRRGRDLLAGLALGCACTIKLHPGLVVFYLLLARRTWAVAGAIATYVAVSLVMMSRLGPSAWVQYAASEKAVVQTWLGDLHNASLDAIIVRLFTPACQARGLPSTTTNALFLGLAVALVVVTWRLTRMGLRRAGGGGDLPFALVTALSVFLNPFVFEHYFLQLIFPLLGAVTALVRGRQQGLSPGVTVAGGVVVAAIVGMLAVDPFTKDAFLGPGHHFRLHFYEVMNWLHIVLLLGLAGSLTAWFGRRDVAPRPAGERHRPEMPSSFRPEARVEETS